MFSYNFDRKEYVYIYGDSMITISKKDYDEQRVPTEKIRYIESLEELLK